jgi:outer membrane protein
VQANVTQAWGQLEAAKAQIDAAQSQVTAAATACARMPASASAPRSTCSMPSRLSSTPARRGLLYRAGGDRCALSPQILGLKIEVYEWFTTSRCVTPWGGMCSFCRPQERS